MNKTTQAILACVDGSLYTDSVCDHAAWVSQRLSMPMRVLHVQTPGADDASSSDLSGAIGFGAKSALLEKLAQMDEARGKLDQQKGKLILEHAKARVHALGIDEVHLLHRRGSLIETINELNEVTPLIVLGKRGEHADFAALHLGSNLERVVRATQKPVLVAARAFKPIQRFVIAYDGGPSTVKALDYVTRQPLLHGLECHLLKVGADHAENRQDLKQAAEQLDAAGFKVQAHLQQGNADQAISDYVQNQKMDLVVMGAYGHSRIRTLIIGSTTSNMLRSCLVPVLMFR